MNTIFNKEASFDWKVYQYNTKQKQDLSFVYKTRYVTFK